MVETATARQGDYTPRTAFEQEFIAGAPAHIDAARNQIALSSVSALAAHLGRFQAGRKTLVVVSDGVTGRASGRGGEALPGLESIVRAANRARIAIYALRPTAEAGATARTASDSPAPPDLLVAMAEQTTGLAVDGSGNVAAGLERDPARCEPLLPARGISGGRSDRRAFSLCPGRGSSHWREGARPVRIRRASQRTAGVNAQSHVHAGRIADSTANDHADSALVRSVDLWRRSHPRGVRLGGRAPRAG